MPDRFELQKLAVPAVSLLIACLAYSSQLLFQYLEPGPLSKAQTFQFNVPVACIWLTYYRAITVSPGQVPTNFAAPGHVSETEDHVRLRYCRKCDAIKPPRSHHCKICKRYGEVRKDKDNQLTHWRCIPKMDHHCPWTRNCVSHFTFPHFMRFLFYAVSSIIYLEYFLWLRVAVIWGNRNLPSYLGPSAGQLAMLFVLMIVNSITLFAVGVVFLRSAYDLCCNTTTIETWEIERHAQLLRRARALGGYLDGPDGMRIRLVHQEFPYDIGIWNNICQGMGSRNFTAWVWPFAKTPITDGLHFPTNGFEDPGTSWPPPDPDRVPRISRKVDSANPFTYAGNDLTPDDEIRSFKQRQQEDYQSRFGNNNVLRRKPFHDRFDTETYEPLRDADLESDEGSGEEGWQDSGGSRLKDYGVDEEVEFYDEDDVPLAELLRQRRMVPTT